VFRLADKEELLPVGKYAPGKEELLEVEGARDSVELLE